MATYDLTSTTPSKLAAGDILNCPYSGSSKNIILPKGIYKLEVWGAQGGYANSTSYIGGKGGYSVGTIELADKETNIYLYSGGMPATYASYTNAGGFNGGGTGGYYYGGGGGGASDIRIGQDSLYSRVIVAGGGGGSQYYITSYGGSVGGGTTGGTVYNAYYGSSYYVAGGTQTSGGSGSWYGTTGSAGSFGTGASVPTYNSTRNLSGAGGGGWYGGASGGYYSSSRYYYRAAQSGSGGSGFVWTGSNAPSGYLLNSAHYLTNASTVDGSTSITSPTGSSETGHTGDGYCRITVIEVSGGLILRSKIDGTWKDNSSAKCKIDGSWKEISSGFMKIDGVWKPIS